MSSSAPELAKAKKFLTAAGLQHSDDEGRWSTLTGGVSSTLWRVELPDRTICVKAALAQLKVAAEWHAPVDRNAVEYAWLQLAGLRHPDNVPRLYALDADAGFFAMQFLEPADHPVWKSLLLQGHVEPAFAGEVGLLLGQLHAESTDQPAIARRFATDANFAALRLDPFLRKTALRHQAVADRLSSIADHTAQTHLALVHGDISPKNILSGPQGPVILDAECAWFGDPAFDVAFCLVHLALKMVVVAGRAEELRQSAHALVDAYAAEISWEKASVLAERAGRLLPALLLARVDGASPVEYLTAPGDAEFVRQTALHMLVNPSDSPLAVIDAWAQTLSARRQVVGQ